VPGLLLRKKIQKDCKKGEWQLNLMISFYIEIRTQLLVKLQDRDMERADQCLPGRNLKLLPQRIKEKML
jgi:hypothetical protein